VLSAGTTNSYDLAIKRLKCYDYDEFCGIYPYNNGQSYNSESPVFACQFCCKANYQHLLALANEDGMIAVQDTRLKNKRHKSGEINAEGKCILVIRISITSGPRYPQTLSAVVHYKLILKRAERHFI
jgi:denticleless